MNQHMVTVCRTAHSVDLSTADAANDLSHATLCGWSKQTVWTVFCVVALLLHHPVCQLPACACPQLID